MPTIVKTTNNFNFPLRVMADIGRRDAVNATPCMSMVMDAGKDATLSCSGKKYPLGGEAASTTMFVGATARDIGRPDKMLESDPVEEMQRQCLRELAALRSQLDESEEENGLLQRQVSVLTSHLTETTQELQHRSALFSDATGRVEKMEAQIADAKKALLTREMRIHELAQQVKTQEMKLEKEAQATSHWEREFVGAKDEVARVTRALHQAKEKLDDKASDATAWKSKLQLAMNTIRELKEELDAKRAREVHLLDLLATAKNEIVNVEKRCKSKIDKREKAIVALEQQLKTLRGAHEQVEERTREIADKEAQWKSSEATQQLERRRQLLQLQDQLQHMTRDLEKTKVNEMLIQRELCRLREELLLSESQRSTEQRRHDQQLKGKDKEMAFIWQKYVEAVATKGGHDIR